MFLFIGKNLEFSFFVGLAFYHFNSYFVSRKFILPALRNYDSNFIIGIILKTYKFRILVETSIEHYNGGNIREYRKNRLHHESVWSMKFHKGAAQANALDGIRCSNNSSLNDSRLSRKFHDAVDKNLESKMENIMQNDKWKLDFSKRNASLSCCYSTKSNDSIYFLHQILLRPVNS